MAVRSAVVNKKLVTAGMISIVEAGTDKPCGDHRSPEDGILADGYTYVHSIDAGSYDGPALWSPESDATLVYQVTSVGVDRSQVEWLADRVRLTLVSRAALGGFQWPFPELAGMKVIHREPDGLSPGVIYEGPPENRVYSVPERYRISVVSI